MSQPAGSRRRVFLWQPADKGEAARARLLLDRALRRDPGGANNPTGIGGRAGKAADVVTVDNVNIDKEGRPTGNSSAQGLRRLEKEASSGNGIALSSKLRQWTAARFCVPSASPGPITGVSPPPKMQ